MSFTIEWDQVIGDYSVLDCFNKFFSVFCAKFDDCFKIRPNKARRVQHGAGKSGSKLTPKIKDWYIRELADLRSLVVACNEGQG